ncbi:MAG TPA: presenilin family intramembrane aspartyl protease [Candidatus Nanoarchaeia archaeon]|nr:presenilin family intramembrane aspartyl protease [Candidatus Nanoarchaeia archaeon]
MKHDLRVIILLAVIFFLSQLMGLTVVNLYIDHTVPGPVENVTFTALPYDIERPDVEESASVYYILAAILVGTILILFIIRIQKFFLWKVWFFLSAFITLGIAFGAFISDAAAFFLALILALWKILRPNIYIHNLTEIFMYGGLAAIFVPILSLMGVSLLLIIISFYDMYAVWHSKHMVKMAKFQAQANVFAGVVIPYTSAPRVSIKKKILQSHLGGEKVPRHLVRNAVVGGGDLGFPLLFSGVVMTQLMRLYSESAGFLLSLIIPLAATAALFLLLYYGRNDRFYPAMPFLTIGCFIGYVILLAAQAAI